MNISVSNIKKAAWILITVFLLQITITSALFSEPLLLQERTPVKIALLEGLRSGMAKVDDKVIFEVREDILNTNRELIISKGTLAFGRILKSKKRNIFGKPGQLAFTCEYTKGIDGTRIPLRSSELGGKGQNNTGAVVATALLVNVLGVFVNGRDMLVNKGTEFVVYVDRDTNINANNVNSAIVAVTRNDTQSVPETKSNITLNDGSVITGMVISLQNGVYTINTNGNEQAIPADKVKSIETLKPAVVTFELADGQTIKGVVLEHKDGAYRVQTSIGDVTIADKDIVKKTE